jgi:HK97 family phage major capsid protein
MEPEIKGLFDEQAKTFEAFKEKNDNLINQVKKLGEDAVTKDEVKRLNEALDAQADQIKAAEKAREQMEAKMGRLSLSGGEGGDAEAKSAAAFGRQVGQDMPVEDFRGYKAAFDTYLRKGADARDLDRKALSVGSDPDGGYLVTPDVSGRIVQKVYETSPARQLFNVVSIGTDALEGLIDNDEADAGWVGETATRSETDSPQLGKWQIPVNEVYAMPTATQKVLEDSSLDLEAWLSGKVADKIARVENSAYFTGNGVLKPKGLLSYTTAATADSSRAWGVFEHVTTGSSGAFDVSSKNGTEKIITLIHALKAAYRNNARFVMNRATLGAIRGLKDSTYQYIWQPSAQAGQPSTLFGYAVAEAEDMPAIAADTLSVAFGDFNEAYQIVDRTGITMLRDPYTTKGYVKFYTRRRTGGGAVNFEAAKFLKFA